MARAPDARVEQAKTLYQQGKKLVEISAAAWSTRRNRPQVETHLWMGWRTFGKEKRAFEKEERTIGKSKESGLQRKWDRL